jgi:hypothetical protein
MQFFYDVHGLVLGSEFPLPELELRRRPATDAPDIRVSIGPLPAAPRRPTDLPYVDAENGRALLRIPGAGRYLVSDGRELVVEPEADADFSYVRLFILGSALGLLCHQRGLLPLHASAVELAGEAIASWASRGRASRPWPPTASPVRRRGSSPTTRSWCRSIRTVVHGHRPDCQMSSYGATRSARLVEAPTACGRTGCAPTNSTCRSPSGSSKPPCR